MTWPPMLDQFGGGATLHAIPEGKLFAHEDHPRAFLEPTLPFLLEAMRTLRS